MTVNDAVAERISKLLLEKGWKLYKLEKSSGIEHGTMQRITNHENKTVTLSTVIRIARGFNMSLLDFLNDELFLSEDLELEKP